MESAVTRVVERKKCFPLHAARRSDYRELRPITLGLGTGSALVPNAHEVDWRSEGARFLEHFLEPRRVKRESSRLDEDKQINPTGNPPKAIPVPRFSTEGFSI